MTVHAVAEANASMELIDLSGSGPLMHVVYVLGEYALGELSPLLDLSKHTVDDVGLEFLHLIPVILRPGIENIGMLTEESYLKDLLDTHVPKFL